MSEERHECPSCGAREQIDEPTRHLPGCPLAYQDPPFSERLRAGIDADPASHAAHRQPEVEAREVLAPHGGQLTHLLTLRDGASSPHDEVLQWAHDEIRRLRQQPLMLDALAAARGCHRVVWSAYNRGPKLSWAHRDDLPAVGERVLVGDANPTFLWRLAAIGIVTEVSAEPVYCDQHPVTVEIDRLRGTDEPSPAASLSQDPSVVLALRVARGVEDDGDHGAAEAEAIRDLVRRCLRSNK